ncbi:MAG: PAS-domain containing protein [Rubrivivax sp.]|nr:PAS-domain containing protein [Rubrivivax sp.]
MDPPLPDARPAPAPDTAELQRENARLAARVQALEWTLEHFSQGVLAIDDENRVQVWNERVVDLLEVPRALLVPGVPVRELIAWQVEHGVFGAVSAPERQPWLNEAQNYLAGRDASLWAVERYQRERRDGRVVEVVIFRAPGGAQVRTFGDITERVQQQKALLASEARFRAMADAAPAFIWESDAQGQPVWFNQCWLQAIGCNLAQALAQPWTRLLHPEGAALPAEDFAGIVRRQAPFEVEVRVLTADGRELWLFDHGIPQHDAEGRFRGYIVYGWDVTARKAAERSLIQARDEAERANRAKSEFLSRMSHELRTPLNAVQGFAQLIEGQALTHADRVLAERARYILRGSRHLLRLINDVLDLARVESGALPVHLQPLALAPVIDGSRHLLEPLAQARGVQVRPPQCPDPPWLDEVVVHADPTRLRQVLLNLLSNAIKFNRPGGAVEVLLCDVEDGVRIEVTDTGPGMTAEQCARLFHAFERLDADDSAIEGAGIGLALSKTLMEAMHGRIGVRSQPGVGSTFWVEFERAQVAPVVAPAVPAVPVEEAPTRSDGRLWRVLYVEDNPVNQLLMQGMLGVLKDLDLRLAADAQSAFDLGAQWPPDLLLLDIQLPGINGHQLLQRLRVLPGLGQTPAVAVSANAAATDLSQAQASGFDHYLTKPLVLDELLAVVTRLLQDGRASRVRVGAG